MIEYNYEPLSEEDALKERFQLMKDGNYRAVIEHAEGKMSASNNPMGVFHLRVWDGEGRPKEVIDYIPFIPSMMWKLRHLCDASGLIKEFEEKKFRPELTIGKDVFLTIRTQKGKEIPLDKLNGKAPGAKYPEKNVVDDYILLGNSQVNYNLQIPNKNEDSFHDDQIPF